MKIFIVFWITVINRGGLVGTCISVYKIILETEEQLSINNVSKLLIKNLDVSTQVKNQLDNLIFAILNRENTDILEIPYKMKLIKFFSFNFYVTHAFII